MAKVLIIEDDLQMVTLLKTLLTMEGYQTASMFDYAGNMIENIRNERPDSLILDVFLGNLNGLDLLRQIRQADDLKDVKVIMISGMDREAECRQAGANDFLLKPYMPDELIRKLQAHT